MGGLAPPTNKTMKILSIRPNEKAVATYRQTRMLSTLGAKFRKELLRKNENIQIGELAKRFKKLGDIWQIKYIEDRHTLDVLYTMRNAVGAKIVIDIDDNVWQMPLRNIAIFKKNGLGDYMSHSRRCINLIESIKAADWVTVSTEPLKNKLKTINQNIVTLPNLIDPKEWKFKRKKHDKIRIGWIYSPTHIPDIDVVKDAIKEIYKKYQDKIEIVVFGTTIDIFDEVPITKIQGVDFKDYPKMLTEAGIDISICPLEDNEFNKCKSNIKWLESTLAGACVVASKVYPYETSIKDGKTGYLAKGKSQWVKKISYLIESEEKRNEMTSNALKEVLEYDFRKDTKWKLFYEAIS